jgi:membrane protein DedA with SNARE-associated domain
VVNDSGLGEWCAPMDAFQTFIHDFSVYGYPVLFIGVLLENAGIPVPGETAVIIAGFLSSPAGGSEFNIFYVILLTVVAAVFGDNVGYWLGHRWARPRLQQGRGFLFLTPKALGLAEGYFHRYGIWTVFFARFIAGLRVVGALAAGTAGMHWPRFFLANASGALAWAVTMSLLGYFFGHSWELLHKWLGRGGLILLGCVILLVGLPYLWRHLRRLRPDLVDKLPRAEIVHGLIVAVLETVCVGLLVMISAGDRDFSLDRTIKEWAQSVSERFPITSDLAWSARIPGTLPFCAVSAGVLAGIHWLKRRSWREVAVLCWALLASEIVGLTLLALLRHEVDPEKIISTPLGFPGMVPLRSLAVFGTMAFVIARQNPSVGRAAYAVATVLVLAATWSIMILKSPLWDTFMEKEQRFTEVLLELTAGGIILFAGIWWLEGYGPGLKAVPGSAHSPTGDSATS